MIKRVPRAYLSGPIRGFDNYNEAAFRHAADFIADRHNFAPVIPHEIEPWDHGDEPCPQQHLKHPDFAHADACFLRGDLLVMLDDCDVIIMLPGWEASAGARLEFQVAATCGMPVYFWFEAGLQLVKADGMVV